MTNKKVRDLLAMIEVINPNELKVNSWWGTFVKDYKEALQIAIKALEQQSCEDAISRKDMLAIFRQSNSLSQAWNGFEKLPPVTPKGKSESEHDHEVVKAYNDGQTYILDKIRAEIEDIPNNENTKPIGTYDYCMGANNERKLILEIIDKYRGDADG